METHSLLTAGHMSERMPLGMETPPENGEKEITGAYPELARELRKLFGTASLRAIAHKTGVNYSTIGSLTTGDRATADSLIKVGRAYHRNPNTLLRLAKLETVPEFDLVNWSGKGPLLKTPKPEGLNDTNFVYQIAEMMEGLPETTQALLVQVVREMYQLHRPGDDDAAGVPGT